MLCVCVLFEDIAQSINIRRRRIQILHDLDSALAAAAAETLTFADAGLVRFCCSSSSADDQYLCSAASAGSTYFSIKERRRVLCIGCGREREREREGSTRMEFRNSSSSSSSVDGSRQRLRIDLCVASCLQWRQMGNDLKGRRL